MSQHNLVNKELCNFLCSSPWKSGGLCVARHVVCRYDNPFVRGSGCRERAQKVHSDLLEGPRWDGDRLQKSGGSRRWCFSSLAVTAAPDVVGDIGCKAGPEVFRLDFCNRASCSEMSGRRFVVARFQNFVSKVCGDRQVDNSFSFRGLNSSSLAWSF
uniref:Uncharacterized protein n=1 Tax=Rhipicephalus microplus TaxID=6941 RepID=A0A6G5AEQ3_RHIMP